MLYEVITQAVQLQGLPEMNLENVLLSDMKLATSKGITIVDASDVKLDNIHLTTTDGKVLEIVNAKNVNITGFDYAFSQKDQITIHGDKCEAISIKSKAGDLKPFVYIGEEVDKDAVNL